MAKARYVYETIISTDAYEPSGKNDMENILLDQFMEALNGWKAVELSLEQVRWRLEMFLGTIDSEIKETGPYKRWNQRCGNILHLEEDGNEHIFPISPYGLHQGYFSVDKKLELLKKRGRIQVNFSSVYDSRLPIYSRVTGCFMEIRKKRLYVLKKGTTCLCKTDDKWLAWYEKYGNKNAFANASEWFEAALQTGVLK